MVSSIFEMGCGDTVFVIKYLVIHLSFNRFILLEGQGLYIREI